MVDSARLNDWIQAVGIFAVVASLVFVGIEVRQNSVATRSATNAAVKDSFLELNLTIASSPELARAMVTSAENPDDALPEDRLRVLALWRALFHVWSNVHRQHLNGTIDPALYAAVVQEVAFADFTSIGVYQIGNLLKSEERNGQGKHNRFQVKSNTRYSTKLI